MANCRYFPGRSWQKRNIVFDSKSLGEVYMHSVSMPELLIVLVIVFLLFGPGRISKIAGELGSALREFRNGLNSDPTIAPPGAMTGLPTASGTQATEESPAADNTSKPTGS